MNQRLILAPKRNPSSKFHQSKARKVLKAVLEALFTASGRYYSDTGYLIDLRNLREKYLREGGTLDTIQEASFADLVATTNERINIAQRRFRTGHLKPISSFYRMIWDTTDAEQKRRQHYWARRVGSVQAHKNAWGFCKGRSCLDACQSHLTYWDIQKPGELSFFAMDLENFFPSITGEMVELAMIAHGFNEGEIADCLNACTFVVNPTFKQYIDQIIATVYGHGAHEIDRFGHSFEQIVKLMTGVYNPGPPGSSLSTVSVPPFGMIEVAGEPLNPAVVNFARELLFRYILGFNPNTTFGTRILIQGSPASPALSNLVAKRMDYRLDAFAKATGLFYGRYADDLCFSWKKRRTRKNLHLLIHSVSKIVRDCGFYVRTDKTIIKGPGMQQAMLGYNLNSGKVTVSRSRRDRVRKFLEGASTLREMDLQQFASVMGEVEFIATAHPEFGQELRNLGNRVIANLGREVKCKAIDLGVPVDDEVVGIMPRKIALW